MGLSGNPEPAENILMEPKMIHTYVHTYITFMSEVVHMYVQYACFKPYAYFSAGQSYEVLRIRIGNMATFQRNILFACNAQNPVLRVCHIKCRPQHKKMQNAFIGEKKHY